MTGPLHAAELVVRASLQKEAVGAFDKAVLRGAGKVLPPALVLGGGAVAANRLMGDPVQKNIDRHRMRMQRIQPIYDPKLRRIT